MKTLPGSPCGLIRGASRGAAGVCVVAALALLASGLACGADVPTTAAPAPELPAASPAPGNPDLTKPIPTLTLTNDAVHKFFFDKTQIYGSVEMIETDPKKGKFVNIKIWDFKNGGGNFDGRPSLSALNPEDQKFVLDWVARHGPDGRAVSSPAPLPGAQGITFSDGPRSYLVDLAGVLKGKTIVAIASGNRHDLALCADGTLAAWGKNEYGELGNGKDGFDTFSIEPVLVDMAPFKGRKVTAIAATGNASVALCADGSLFTWGSFAWNERIPHSQTLIPHNRPALFAEGVLKGRKVVAISAVQDYCLALCADGRLVEWGTGFWGNEVTFKSHALVDNQGALQGKTITKVVAGLGWSNLALCSDGTLVFWRSEPRQEAVPAAPKAAKPPPSASPGPSVLKNVRLDSFIKVPVALVDETGALQGKTVTDMGYDGDLFALCSDGTLVTWKKPTYSLLPSKANKRTMEAADPNPIVLSGKDLLEGKTVQAMAVVSGSKLFLCTDNTVIQPSQNGLLKGVVLDPAHILPGRKVQAITPNGLVLFQQPGGESTAGNTPAQP